MTEQTCYLCHDTNAVVTLFHTDFPRGAAHLVECKVCSKYGISQAITQSVKTDSQEKRMQLQQDVNALKAPPGKLVFIDRNPTKVIVVRLIEDSTN